MTTESSSKIVLFVFVDDQDAVDRLHEGGVSLPRAPRQRGRHVGDPHLQADIVIPYFYLDESSAERGRMTVPGVVYRCHQPAQAVIRKGRDFWVLAVTSSELELNDLDFLVDPRSDGRTYLRGEPQLGIARLLG